MEEDDHIEVPAKVGGEIIPKLFHKSETLERDATSSFCPAFEIFRIIHDILLHHLDKRTARVDDDGLILALGGFDVGQHFIERGADRGVLTVLGLHTAHPIVRIDSQNLGSRLGEGGLPDTGGTLDDDRHLFVGVIQLICFLNCH